MVLEIFLMVVVQMEVGLEFLVPGGGLCENEGGGCGGGDGGGKRFHVIF